MLIKALVILPSTDMGNLNLSASEAELANTAQSEIE